MPGYLKAETKLKLYCSGRLKIEKRGFCLCRFRFAQAWQYATFFFMKVFEERSAAQSGFDILREQSELLRTFFRLSNERK